MTHHRYDAAQLRESVAVSDVVGRFVELTRAGGDELKGLCPFHVEQTPSFHVNNKKRLWICFGCGRKGGVIDFVMEREGVDLAHACEIVAQLAGIAAGSPVVRASPAAVEAARARQADEQRFQVVMPIPSDAPPPPEKHFKLNAAPSRMWTYRNAAGEPLGYVCRFDLEVDGKRRKEVIPLHYTTAGWRWTSAPKPRPLYGLEELARRPEAVVLLVEGEKACDAARQLMPEWVCVAWPGGSKAIQHVDWQPLDGRRVVMWPDFDHVAPVAGPRKPKPDELAPGDAAAVAIYEATK